MKINGTSSIGSTPQAARAKATGGGFSLSGGARAGTASAAAGVSPGGIVGSVDALLALQEQEGPLERRRRAIRRAGGILDRLEAVKLAMLSGETPVNALSDLARSVREERGEGGDPGLDDVLAHIETRAAVELAKAERSRAA
ncbi:MAG TPA: flagellar assembly protein FliX [Caulobacteraceae bacterium]